MRGGETLERKRSQGEPDDNAEPDEREARELVAPRARLAQQREQRGGERGRHDRPADTHDDRIELLDREPGRREREAEDEHADRAEEKGHRRRG